MEQKTDYFGGEDSSYLFKKYQRLENTKSLPTLSIKIVYVFEIWYFKNMKKNEAMDTYGKVKYVLTYVLTDYFGKEPI